MRWPTIPLWLRLAVFGPVMAVWTYLLLEPKPVPEAVLKGIAWFDWGMLHFLLAKSLHLTAYALLAVLGGPLLSRDRRWLIFAGLILHGVLTEIGQMYVPNRFGCVRDMLIDAAGVTVGAVSLNLFSRDAESSERSAGDSPRPAPPTPRRG